MKTIFKLTNSNGETLYIHSSSESAALQSAGAAMLAGDGPIFKSVVAEQVPLMGQPNPGHLYIGIIHPV